MRKNILLITLLFTFLIINSSLITADYFSYVGQPFDLNPHNQGSVGNLYDGEYYVGFVDTIYQGGQRGYTDLYNSSTMTIMPYSSGTYDYTTPFSSQYIKISGTYYNGLYILTDILNDNLYVYDDIFGTAIYTRKFYDNPLSIAMDSSYIYYSNSNGLSVQLIDGGAYSDDIVLGYQPISVTHFNNTFFTVEQITSGSFLNFTIRTYTEDFDLIDTFETSSNLAPTTTIAVGGAIVPEQNYLLLTNAYYGDRVMGFYNVTYAPQINYNFTDLYDDSLCVTENILCNLTTVTTSSLTGAVQYICENYSNVQYCSDGYINKVDSDGYNYGVCEQLGCENECNIIGQDSCTSQNTYAKCGQYDADACLEYGSVFYCPSTQYCYTDELGGYCDLLQDEETTYTQQRITVLTSIYNNTGILQSNSDTLIDKVNEIKDYILIGISPLTSFVTKTIDTFTIATIYDEINITTSTTVYNNDYSQSLDYIAFDCDYRESLISFDDLTQGVSPTTSWSNTVTTETFGGFERVYTDNISKTISTTINPRIETIINILQNETTVNNIQLRSDSDVLLNFEITYNYTNYELSIIETVNNKILVSSIGTSNNIDNIYFDITTINNINTSTVNIQVERLILGQYIDENYYSLPLSISNTGINNVNYLSDSNLYIYQIGVSKIDDYPIFNKNTENNKILQCSYSNNGCYVLKIYGNEQGMPTYYFDDEKRTCVNGIDGEYIDLDVQSVNTLSTVEKLFKKSFNDEEKILFSTIIILILFGFGLVGSYVIGEKIIILITSLICGLLLVYFVIIGFIPLWIIVLFGIIGGTIATIFVKNVVLGTGGN